MQLQKFQTFIVFVLSQFNQRNWLRIRDWRTHFRAFIRFVLTKGRNVRYNKLVKLSLSAVRSILGSGTLELPLRRFNLKVKEQAEPTSCGGCSDWKWTRLSSQCVGIAGHNQINGSLLASRYSLFCFRRTIFYAVFS